MYLIRSRAALAAILASSALAVAACRGGDAGSSRHTASSADTSLAGLSAAARSGDTAARRALARATAPAPVPPLAASDSGPLGAHRPSELDDAARRIIGFLRGEVPFDRIRVADTVTFYVPPEGGGARTTLDRRQLRNRSSWRVRALGAEASLVPPRELTRLTTRVGGHFNCREYRLSLWFPELARLPHVGTRLDPGEGSSCLQTRNATFVFGPDAKPPTLVAVVYDQPEW